MNELNETILRELILKTVQDGYEWQNQAELNKLVNQLVKNILNSFTLI